MAERKEAEMFLEIYQQRVNAGTWKSDVSGKPLPHPHQDFFVWSFGHLCAKSTFPRYKLNPDNIALFTSAEHTFYDNFTEASKRKALYKLYERNWLKIFDRRDALKEKYFAERNNV